MSYRDLRIYCTMKNIYEAVDGMRKTGLENVDMVIVLPEASKNDFLMGSDGQLVTDSEEYNMFGVEVVFSHAFDAASGIVMKKTSKMDFEQPGIVEECTGQVSERLRN